MDWFTVSRPLAGVSHIRDALGVCVTLLEGEKAALLVDTGYGVGDLRGLVASLTDKPLSVVNTHGHYDHTFGNYQFESVLVPAPDLPLLSGGIVGFSPLKRAQVWKRAAQAGFDGPGMEDYLTAGMGAAKPLDQDAFDLGGMRARVLRVPGHTPGSVCLLVEPHGLLLTGDNWNPTTWIFFPHCMPALAYGRNMRALLKEPFTCALAPHFAELVPGGRVRAYIEGLREETFAAAVPRPMPQAPGADTRLCRPEPGTELVFDAGRM